MLNFLIGVKNFSRTESECSTNVELLVSLPMNTHVVLGKVEHLFNFYVANANNSSTSLQRRFCIRESNILQKDKIMTIGAKVTI
jgi:hypothetical protein